MDVKMDGERSEAGLLSLLTQLYKALNRRSSEELLGMRLKPYIVLGYLRDHPGASQHDLERALFMDANAVVLMLNELEAAGHVIRRRDPQDRRRHIVELTPAGRHAVEQADRAREGLEDEVLATLSADERKTLRRLLERVLNSMLQAVAAPRA